MIPCKENNHSSVKQFISYESPADVDQSTSLISSRNIQSWTWAPVSSLSIKHDDSVSVVGDVIVSSIQLCFSNIRVTP